jgi:hypothetical protein
MAGLRVNGWPCGPTEDSALPERHPFALGSADVALRDATATRGDGTGAATTRENELASLRQAEESQLRISSFSRWWSGRWLSRSVQLPTLRSARGKLGRT